MTNKKTAVTNYNVHKFIIFLLNISILGICLFVVLKCQLLSLGGHLIFVEETVKTHQSLAGNLKSLSIMIDVKHTFA